ncbi:MAG: flagellar protein FlaG [Treponema sp.]|nr:MAG: flagellar protein FlaG [Treponema sp.]HQL32441.1 flagellar protein FlaG [Treponemataceae bacterium]
MIQSVSRMIRINASFKEVVDMSIDIAQIGQQTTAMDRRLEGSVNSTLRTTTAALQQTAQTADAQETEPGQDNGKVLAEDFARQMEAMSSMFDRKLQFKVNEELHRVIVKVIDANTDKVIREIPSAEIQKLQMRIKEALGLLFDESR